jgi:hypothetical protein
LLGKTHVSINNEAFPEYPLNVRDCGGICVQSELRGQKTNNACYSQQTGEGGHCWMLCMFCIVYTRERVEFLAEGVNMAWLRVLEVLEVIGEVMNPVRLNWGDRCRS